MKTVLFLLTRLLMFQAVLCFTNIDFSTTTLSADQGLKALGGNQASWLGYDVYRAGDVNKDGIDDFIIGASHSNTNSNTQSGAVFVIYGSKSGPAQIDLSTDPLDLAVGFKISGSSANDLLGSASTAGDFNSDGVDDVVVGAYSATYSGRTAAGSVYVIYGVQGGLTAHINLSALTISQGVQIGGPAPSAMVGFNVRPGGDMNGDSIADIVFTAPNANLLSRNSVGATYVIYGKKDGYSADIDLNSLDFSVGYKIIGVSASDMFGYNLGPGRDLNGDNINDVIASTYQSSANYIAVIWGQQGGVQADVDLNIVSVFQGIKINLSDSLGKTSLDAIDFDNDGFMDLIIGSTASNRIYIMYGVQDGFDSTYTLPVIPYSSRTVVAPFSLSCADINGDGYGDIIAGSAPSGSVIFGRAEKTTNTSLSAAGQVLKFSPKDPSYNFANSAATADINGDGLPDVMYGSDYEKINGQDNAGSVFVIYSSK